jgi:hypothetical protein
LGVSLDFRVSGPWRIRTTSYCRLLQRGLCVNCCLSVRRLPISLSWKFNANKFKCLKFLTSRYAKDHMPQLPVFKTGGNLLGKVTKWPHLGHISNNTFPSFLDDFDILASRNSLVGQINNCLYVISLS